MRAALNGHVECVKEILKMKPDLLVLREALELVMSPPVRHPSLNFDSSPSLISVDVPDFFVDFPFAFPPGIQQREKRPDASARSQPKGGGRITHGSWCGRELYGILQVQRI